MFFCNHGSSYFWVEASEAVRLVCWLACSAAHTQTRFARASGAQQDSEKPADDRFFRHEETTKPPVVTMFLTEDREGRLHCRTRDGFVYGFWSAARGAHGHNLETEPSISSAAIRHAGQVDKRFEAGEAPTPPVRFTNTQTQWHLIVFISHINMLFVYMACSF